jgi:hypothetical protein
VKVLAREHARQLTLFRHVCPQRTWLKVREAPYEAVQACLPVALEQALARVPSRFVPERLYQRGELWPACCSRNSGSRSFVADE